MIAKRKHKCVYCGTKEGIFHDAEVIEIRREGEVCDDCFRALSWTVGFFIESAIGVGNHHRAVPRSQVQYDGACLDW